MKFNLFDKLKEKFSRYDIIVPVFAHGSCIYIVDRKRNIMRPGIYNKSKGYVTYVKCNKGDEIVIVGEQETTVTRIRQ